MHSDLIESVSLGIEEDWWWTAQCIYEDKEGDGIIRTSENCHSICDEPSRKGAYYRENTDESLDRIDTPSDPIGYLISKQIERRLKTKGETTMNNIIKPNTYIKVLSQDHLSYVIGLAEDNGWKRWGSGLSKSNTNFINFHSDMDYTLDKSGLTMKGWEEIFIPMPEDSPKPPFKIRNADHPAVRQWLKDIGCEWCSGDDLTKFLLKADQLLIHDCKGVTNSNDGNFDGYPYPELTLNLAVTSWSLPDPVDSAKQERMERIKVIEAELTKLKELNK